MRRVVVLLLGALLTLVTLAGSPAEARSTAGRYAEQAFVATNAQRADNGLTALQGNRCLKHAAVRQAKLMAERERIFHQDPGALMRNCTLDAAGENLAEGFPTGRSVVDDGWMISAGHRANILNPAFTLMGIGARKGHDGHWYVAQVFGHKK